MGRPLPSKHPSRGGSVSGGGERARRRQRRAGGGPSAARPCPCLPPGRGAGRRGSAGRTASGSLPVHPDDIRKILRLKCKAVGLVWTPVRHPTPGLGSSTWLSWENKTRAWMCSKEMFKAQCKCKGSSAEVSLMRSESQSDCGLWRSVLTCREGGCQPGLEPETYICCVQSVMSASQSLAGFEFAAAKKTYLQCDWEEKTRDWPEAGGRKEEP